MSHFQANFMVDSSQRRGGRAPLMSNHNRCWIWGRNVVLETLRAGRWPVLELMIGDRVSDDSRTIALQAADRMGVHVVMGTDSQLAKACRSEEHQGLAARMTSFPFWTLAEVMQRIPNDATVALLDRVQDPFNVGAIIRSASTLGIDAIIVGEKEQSDINSQVARSSAGAVNHLPIGRTAELADAVRQLKSRGFQIVAASEKASSAVYDVDFRRQTLIVIGNEGRGIHSELLTQCDVSVSIPMTGRVGSLNAAVAAGILFYEIRRQKSQPVSSTGTRTGKRS